MRIKRPTLVPIAHNRKPSKIPLVFGFSGEIEIDCLADLIQFLALSHSTTVLSIVSAKGSGSIWFSEGMIVHAGCGDLQGYNAFYQILTWKHGSFSMERRASAPLRTINVSVSALLLKALHRIDERNKEAEAAHPHEGRREKKHTSGEVVEPPQARGEEVAQVQPSARAFFFESAVRQITEIDGYLSVFLVQIDGAQVLDSNSSTKTSDIGPLARHYAETIAIYRRIGAEHQDLLEELIFSLSTQFHIIRRTQVERVFICLTVDRMRVTLGEAKILLKNAESKLYREEIIDFI